MGNTCAGRHRRSLLPGHLGSVGETRQCNELKYNADCGKVTIVVHLFSYHFPSAAGCQTLSWDFRVKIETLLTHQEVPVQQLGALTPAPVLFPQCTAFLFIPWGAVTFPAAGEVSILPWAGRDSGAPTMLGEFSLSPKPLREQTGAGGLLLNTGSPRRTSALPSEYPHPHTATFGAAGAGSSFQPRPQSPAQPTLSI